MLLFSLVGATMAALSAPAESDTIKRELLDAEVGLRELNAQDLKPLQGLVNKAISAAPKDEMRRFAPGFETGMGFNPSSLVEEGAREPSMGQVAIQEANQGIMETLKHEKEHTDDLESKIDSTWDNIDKRMEQQPSDFSAFFEKVGFKPDPNWKPDSRSKLEIDTQNAARQMEQENAGMRQVANSFAETDEKSSDLGKMSMQELGKNLEKYVAQKQAELRGAGPSSFLETDPAGLQQVSAKLLAIENSLKRDLGQKASPSSFAQLNPEIADPSKDVRIVEGNTAANIQNLKEALRLVGNNERHDSATVEKLLGADAQDALDKGGDSDDDGSSLLQTSGKLPADDIHLTRGLEAVKQIEYITKKAEAHRDLMKRDISSLEEDKAYLKDKDAQIRERIKEHTTKTSVNGDVAARELRDFDKFRRMSPEEQERTLKREKAHIAQLAAERDAAEASSLLQTGSKGDGWKAADWMDDRHKDEFDLHEKHIDNLTKELQSRIGKLKKLHTELEADKAANEKREKSHPHSKIYGLLQEIVAGKHPQLAHAGEEKFTKDMAKLNDEEEHLRTASEQPDQFD